MRYAFARERVDTNLAAGIPMAAALARTCMDLGHGDGRGRWSRWFIWGEGKGQGPPMVGLWVSSALATTVKQPVCCGVYQRQHDRSFSRKRNTQKKEVQGEGESSDLSVLQSPAKVYLHRL